ERTKPGAHQRHRVASRGDERQEATDEERGPDEHVEHAVHAHALVVGLEKVRTRREGDAGMLEALEQPREDAAQQRDVRYQEVGSGESLLWIACALLGVGQSGCRHALPSPSADALTTPP